MKHLLTFYECEHEDDLDWYIADILKCLNKRGKIINIDVNYDAELGSVLIEFIDEREAEEFWKDFKKTPSYGFMLSNPL